MIQICITFAGFIVIFYAILSIFKGETSYSNYWGGSVFAPFAILIGLLVIYIAWFKSKSLNKPLNKNPDPNDVDNYRKW